MAVQFLSLFESSLPFQMSDGVNIISPGSPLWKGRLWKDEKVGVISLKKRQYRFSLLRAKVQ